MPLPLGGTSPAAGGKASQPQESLALAPAPKPSLPIHPADHPAALVSGTPSAGGTLSDFSQYSRYLLIADGDQGNGSACLVKYQGRVRVITNSHVLSGNDNVHFQEMNSTQVQTGPFSYAYGADLAAADQSTARDGLEVADVSKEVNIGDDVVVLGNSLGSDVITEIKGQVKGIGPDLVEVDAKFVEGNSGSPIIQVKTGKVIGIATYAEQRKMDSLSKDSQFGSEWRRFGYRLDTVRAWQHVAPEEFASEARTVEAVQKQTEDLFRLGQDIYAGKIDLSKHQAPDNRLRDIVTEFMQANTNRDKSSAASVEARMEFERALIFETHEDVANLREEDFTWFHWQELKDEIAARDFLKKEFERLLNTDEADDQVMH